MAKLREYEWVFITRMISRIYCAPTYEELCKTVFQQMKTVIAFDWAICFKTTRQDGHGTVYDPISSNPDLDFSFFLNGKYPQWSEFIMVPESTVFRQSELIGADEWEKSRVYQEIWAPLKIYYGLFLSVVSHDDPLSLFGFFRGKNSDDFSERDIYILNILREAIEMRASQLLRSESGGPVLPLRQAAAYGLTHREAEIAALICRNLDTQAICKQLCITVSTLNKHMSNLFAKTGTKNRMQLYLLLQNASG